MNTKTIHIPNMNCEHCVGTIETELNDMDGITSARTNLSAKSVTIDWDDSVSWDSIIALLNEINYPPSE